MPLNKLRFFCKTKIPFLLGSNGLYFRVTIWWWVSVGFAYLSPAISQVAGLYGSVREVGYKYNFVRRLSVLLFLLLHFFHTRFFRWQKKGDKGQVAQVSRFFQLPRCFFVCFWCFGVGQESWKHDLGSFLGFFVLYAWSDFNWINYRNTERQGIRRQILLYPSPSSSQVRFWVIDNFWVIGNLSCCVCRMYLPSSLPRWYGKVAWFKLILVSIHVGKFHRDHVRRLVTPYIVASDVRESPPKMLKKSGLGSIGKVPTRWAPSSYKWSYNLFSWPFQWVSTN